MHNKLDVAAEMWNKNRNYMGWKHGKSGSKTKAERMRWTGKMCAKENWTEL